VLAAFAKRARKQQARARIMKPAPFKYIAACSLDQALSLKAKYGDEARFLAGGQSLIPAMNFRLARPEVLIDINGLPELAGIDRPDRETIRVGAVTRYRALERDADFLRECPLFADALPHIAHPQIRNRGTIGGNLSHADPASELPAVATAMRARMKIRSSNGERELEASEFFAGLLTTSLEPEEMLVEISFPVHKPRSGSCFMEVARRRGDFALAGVAAIVSLDEDGRCTEVRLALCGVGETPVDASAAASSLVGQRCTGKAIEAVAADLQGAIDPPGSIHASADYQRHIAGVLARRAIAAAHERAVHA
jgi:CO/xanthine dehydrogenase FAD-binding subunit